jgi:hypothetical protein
MSTKNTAVNAFSMGWRNSTLSSAACLAPESVFGVAAQGLCATDEELLEKRHSACYRAVVRSE